MSLATLDTHAVVKDLQSAGFTDAQAEAVARNIHKAQDLDLSTLATKVDLEKVRTDLTAEIARVRSDLTAEIAKLRNEFSIEIGQLRTSVADMKGELAKWMFTAMGFQTLVIIGAVLALLKLVKP